jgi:hypothetical protein
MFRFDDMAGRKIGVVAGSQAVRDQPRHTGSTSPPTHREGLLVGGGLRPSSMPSANARREQAITLLIVSLMRPTTARSSRHALPATHDRSPADSAQDESYLTTIAKRFNALTRFRPWLPCKIRSATS